MKCEVSLLSPMNDKRKLVRPNFLTIVLKVGMQEDDPACQFAIVW